MQHWYRYTFLGRDGSVNGVIHNIDTCTVTLFNISVGNLVLTPCLYKIKHFQITFQTSRILYHRIMGLLMRSSGIFLMFCVYCFVNGGPLFSDEMLNMGNSFTKDLPLSMQRLLDKFMESVDAINSDENSDISFHSLGKVSLFVIKKMKK